MCMKYLLHMDCNATYTVGSDSLLTDRKWQGIEIIALFKEDEWEEIDMIRMLQVKCINNDLKKVKSHATAQEMEKGLSAPELRYGNDRVNYWAGKGAEIYQVSEQSMKLVNQVDAETWTIQRG